MGIVFPYFTLPCCEKLATERQFSGCIPEFWQTQDGEVLVVKALRQEGLAAFLDRGEHPWLSILVAICSLSQVDFLGGGIRGILSG